MSPLPLSRLARTALALPAAALLLSVPNAFPQVAYDAQVPFSLSGVTLVSPRGVAVAPDGTVYLADNGTVVRITPSGVVGTASAATVLAPSGVTLKTPTALAVDSKSNLYIADAAGGQVVEVTNPEGSAPAGITISYGSTTETPTALAVDSKNNLYIADETQGGIWEATGGTAIQLAITTGLKPVGLAVDSSFNVYFADAVNNYVYEYSGGTTTAFLKTSTPGNFNFSGTHTVLPVGMGVDPAGNLYILDSQNDRVIEDASGTTFEVPFSSITHPGSMTVSGAGNLYMSDDSNEAIDELFYNNNPVNFGTIAAGTASPSVTLNYNFIGAVSGLNFLQSVQGDNTGEFVAPGSDPCLNTPTKNPTGAKAGTQCDFQFHVKYQDTTPGLRDGVFGLTDSFNDILAVPAIGISRAAALALYPGSQATVENSTSTTKLLEPQGLAVTGNGGYLFVADEGGNLGATPQTYVSGGVYKYANGAGNPTELGCCEDTTPMALAINPAGALYIANYGSGSNGSGNGTITVVPSPWTGFGTQLTIPGVTLYHPMALAFDPTGNLYIGDMGPEGTAATAGNPGFIVEVPVNGGKAFILNTGSGVPIVFPQALVTDSAGNLYVADGGDGQTDLGGVDVVPAATGTAVALPFTGDYAVSSPAGLGFDAAGDLYVLDSYNQRILEAPVTYTNGIPSLADGISLLGQGTSGIQSVLVTASNLVVWPTGQNITIADIGFQPVGGGQSTPAQVITLQSKNAYVDASSGSATVYGVDVGNQGITFTGQSQTGATDFTLAGCGTSTSTVATNVSNYCTSTVNYKGPGQQTSTFTLNSTLTLSNSLLGNEIVVTAEPNLPTGELTQSNPQGGIITVTLENVGLQALDVTNVALGAGASGMLISGGTCSSTTQLSQNQSCTVLVTMSDISFGDVVITDNNNGVTGTKQSIFLFYFFGLNTGVGGARLAAAETEAQGASNVPSNKITPDNKVNPAGRAKSNKPGRRGGDF